jgi:hypothetical protein
MSGTSANLINKKTATNAELAGLGLSRSQWRNLGVQGRKNALNRLMGNQLLESQPVSESAGSVLNSYTPPAGIMNYISGKTIVSGNKNLGKTSRNVLFSKSRKHRANRKSRRNNRRNNRKTRRN